MLIFFTVSLLLLSFLLITLISSAEFILAEFLIATVPMLVIAVASAYFLTEKIINQHILAINQAISKQAAVTKEFNFERRLVSNDSEHTGVIKRVSRATNNVTRASDKLKGSSALISESANDVECRLALTATSSEHIAFNANAIAKSIAEASGNVNSVSASVYQLSSDINTIASRAKQASSNMVGLHHSFDHISQDINIIASFAEKMLASMKDVAKNAHHATRISSDAIASVQEILTTLKQQSEAAKKIGELVKSIISIAEQTEALALNEMVQSVSVAGDADKGFAVVKEIKTLALQTAETNNKIHEYIEKIQNYAMPSLECIQAINTIIQQAAEINQTIDCSVEQQSASVELIVETVNRATEASKESALSLQETNKGLKEITHSVAEFSQDSLSSAHALKDVALDVKKAANSSTEVSTSIEKVNGNLHSIHSTLGKMMQEIELSHENAAELSKMTHILVQSTHSFNFQGDTQIQEENHFSDNSELSSSLMSRAEQFNFKMVDSNNNEELLIKWDLNVYSVGIKEINRQHETLVELINRLDYGVKHKISKETMEDIVNYLVDYTVFHFGYEEKLLSENNWPEFDSHKAIHNAFVDKVKSFQIQLKTQNIMDVAENILEFLKSWILDHILKCDKQYGPFLNAKGFY